MASDRSASSTHICEYPPVYGYAFDKSQGTMTYCTPDIFEGNIHRFFIYMNIDIISVVVNCGQKHL